MTVYGSPAFDLITACCRWPADERRVAAVGRAAALGPNWDQVVRLAERHRVEPLVANGLTAVGVTVPLALQTAVRQHRGLALRDVAETHAWFRLKWIADFNALLSAVAGDERDGVMKRAQTLGVGNALEAGVDLSRLLFSDASRVAPPSRLVALSLGAIEEDEEGVKRFADEARMYLDSSVSYRVLELLNRLRGSEDRLRFPLSRRWRFLYPFLRVPMWVSRRISSRRGG